MVKSKLKIRTISFVMAFLMVFLLLPITPAYAASGESAWGIALTNKSVTLDGGGTGTIYAEEGFTIIGVESNSYHVSYSTASGEKKGHITKDNVYGEFSGTRAGTITANCTVRYQDNTYSGIVGSVYKGETVALLCDLKHDNGWYYIEYNTNANGRKRGFVPKSCVSPYSGYVSENLAYFANDSGVYSSNADIHRGPGLYYEKLGNLYGKSYIRFTHPYMTINNRTWYLVFYTDSNGEQKTGYIHN